MYGTPEPLVRIELTTARLQGGQIASAGPLAVALHSQQGLYQRECVYVGPLSFAGVWPVFYPTCDNVVTTGRVSTFT